MSIETLGVAVFLCFFFNLKDVESPGEDDQGVEFTASNVEAMHARFSTGGSLDINEGSSPLNSSDDEVHIPRVSLVVGGVSLHILHGNIWVTIV